MHIFFRIIINFNFGNTCSTAEKKDRYKCRRERGPNTMPTQENAVEGMPDRRMEAKERSRAAGPELRNI